MTHDFNILHRGEFKLIQVKYKYKKGAASTNPRLVPDDPATIYLEQVFYKSRKIIRYLTDRTIDELEGELWKKHD